jgi:hypothetical protein
MFIANHSLAVVRCPDYTIDDRWHWSDTPATWDLNRCVHDANDYEQSLYDGISVMSSPSQFDKHGGRSVNSVSSCSSLGHSKQMRTSVAEQIKPSNGVVKRTSVNRSTRETNQTIAKSEFSSEFGNVKTGGSFPLSTSTGSPSPMTDGIES